MVNRKEVITVNANKNLRGNSTKWMNYQSTLSKSTCDKCEERHGKIVSADDWKAKITIALHMYCGCILVYMRTKNAGYATDSGKKGADYYLYYYGVLPSYYVTKEKAKLKGWNSSKGNLNDVLPGTMIGENRFYNDKGKLPSAVNRIWYEADINYKEGYRGPSRILYSNDGLIFATYDHYQTFYEITR